MKGVVLGSNGLFAPKDPNQGWNPDPSLRNQSCCFPQRRPKSTVAFTIIYYLFLWFIYMVFIGSFTMVFNGSFSMVFIDLFSMVFLWIIYYLFLWCIYYLFIYWANRSIFTIWQLLLFGPRLNFAKSLYNQADDGAKCLLKLEREKGEAFEIRNAFCDAVSFLLQICSRATIICRFTPNFSILDRRS